ncbi:MAG: hypothetical protein KAW56_07845 [Candidatus Marinimicrobia bacterium]|nr:hypothetical protein [Candidatus Neomarinimicrobiota bacterium]
MKIELSEKEIEVLIKCIDTAIMFYITHKWKIYSKKEKLEGDSLNKLKEKFCITILERREMMIKIGDMVEDTVTGFRGMAVAKIIYMTGCVQFEIQPKGLKDGRPIKSMWIDEKTLINKETGMKEINFEPTGGSGHVPSEFSHP